MSSASDVDSSKGSPVRVLKDCDTEEMSALVRGGDAEFVQVGSGKSSSSAMRLDLEGVNLLSVSASNRTVAHAASRADRRVVTVPLSWTSDLRLNGREPDGATALVWGASADLIRTGSDVAIATLLFDHSMLARKLADWTGRSPDEWDSLTGDFLIPNETTQAFVSKVKGIVQLAHRRPEAFTEPGLRAQLPDILLQSVFQAVLDSGNAAAKQSLSSLSHRRIVTRARDYMETHHPNEVTLLHLCRATGVSARSLENAFNKFLGITPMRYLKIWRLRKARMLLRRHPRSEKSVSQCAYAVGFTHLGRFAFDYRNLFGYKPSDTCL